MAFPFQVHFRRRIVEVECEFARNMNTIRRLMTS